MPRHHLVILLSCSFPLVLTLILAEYNAQIRKAEKKEVLQKITVSSIIYVYPVSLLTAYTFLYGLHVHAQLLDSKPICMPLLYPRR